MNTDGSKQTRLTNTERRNDSPTLTPDGRFILFTSNRDISLGAEIYVMDINRINQYPLSNYIGAKVPGLMAGRLRRVIQTS